MGKYIKMNGLQVVIVVFPDHIHLLFEPVHEISDNVAF